MLRGLLIPLMFSVIMWEISVVVIETDRDSDHPPLIRKYETAILASPDGMIHLVDINSGYIFWSFSSGPSICSSSHQLHINHKGQNLNAPVDSGEACTLFLHGTGLMKAKKLPLGAEEFLERAPVVSVGGGVMLGSKTTSVFVVETGEVVRNFTSDNLPQIGERVADETSISSIKKRASTATSSMDVEALEKPLIVTRTDHALQYISTQTGEVLSDLKVSDIEASYQCEENDFLGGFPHKNSLGHCQARPVVHRISRPISNERITVLNIPVEYVSEQRLAETVGLSIPLHVPPSIIENNMVSIELVLPFVSDWEELMDDVRMDSISHPHLWPSLLCSALVPIAMAFFYRAKRAISRKRGVLHPRLEAFEELQNATPEEREHESFVNRHSIPDGEMHIHGTSMDERMVQNATPEEREDHESMDERRIGKMVVTRKLIAKGSSGTAVVEGNYDDRPVAVKRLVQTHHDVAMKEVKNLIESDQHPNIVRYYGVEWEEDFIYICLERCTCSLFDLITYCSWLNRVPTSNRSRKPPPSINCSDMKFMSSLQTNEKLQLWTNGYPTKLLLKLMREIVCGLAHLHDLKFIHGDLKPQNILISKDKSLLTAKLSDMGMSKQLDGDMSSLSNHGHGSSGWRAPEQLRNERLTRATDEFNLGLLIYFCSTGGQHPFGESIDRDVNIKNDEKDLFLIEHIPEARDLISRLLDPDPKMRPKAPDVKHHPLFWSSDTRLSFFRDVSNRVELEDRKNASSELLKGLEDRGKAIFNGKYWDRKIKTDLIKEIEKKRRYKFDSVCELLRAIRNILNHYGEYPSHIQAIWGSNLDGFNSYFATKFPKLLIDVYLVIHSHCSEEESFQKYFISTHEL